MSAPGEESESRKRPREGEIFHGDQQDETPLSLMMVIPEWAAPKIIGKGGEVIKQIESNTGARVSFLHEQQSAVSAPGRVCAIVGNPRSCTLATYAISRILSDQPDLCAEWSATVSSSSGRTASAGTPRSHVPPPPAPAAMHDQRAYHQAMPQAPPPMAAPPSQHYPPPPPQHQQYWPQHPYQRDPSEIAHPWAPQPYQNPMEGLPQPQHYRPPPPPLSRGPRQTNAKAIVDVVVARDLSGPLIGRRGENINGVQTRTGAKIDLIRSTDQISDHSLRVAGDAGVVLKGLEHVLSILQVLGGSAGERPYINLDEPVPLDNVSTVTSCTVSVPSEKVGSIIGSGGENVRDIETISGAKVSFDRTERTETARPVSIRGGNQSVMLAVGKIFAGLEALDIEKKLPANFFKQG